MGIIAGMSAAALFICTVAVIGMFTGADNLTSWGLPQLMAAPTAFCIMLNSASIIILVLRVGKKERAAFIAHCK
jgi:hypothetical protein